MKKPSIVFAYNLQKEAPDLASRDSMLEADGDDIATITAMIKNLRSIGARVIPLDADEKAYMTLYRRRHEIDMVFNYTVGKTGFDHYAHIPSILEMLALPYTGSRPLTQALVSNKATAKKFMSLHGIPTLPAQLFYTADDELDKRLHFPLLVKPSAIGSSAGITKKSIVQNEKELRKQVALLLKIFNDPVLVEPYASGREFSVSLLGNPPKILAIAELDYSILPSRFAPIASMELKNMSDNIDTEFLKCPAVIDKALRTKIENMCLKAVSEFEIFDWCRIDIRCYKNEPYMLEINSPASLEPPEVVKGYCTYPHAATVAGLSYPELLKAIINEAAKRYQLKWRL